jgi:hypothetical protein
MLPRPPRYTAVPYCFVGPPDANRAHYVNLQSLSFLLLSCGIERGEGGDATPAHLLGDVPFALRRAFNIVPRTHRPARVRTFARRQVTCGRYHASPISAAVAGPNGRLPGADPGYS